jgi:hypothetical protein
MGLAFEDGHRASRNTRIDVVAEAKVSAKARTTVVTDRRSDLECTGKPANRRTSSASRRRSAIMLAANRVMWRSIRASWGGSELNTTLRRPRSLAIGRCLIPQHPLPYF